MSELATESQGCSVISASSNDLVHIPTSIISRNGNSSFWMSTGIFPQEIVIQLGAASLIKTVDIISMGVRKIQLDKCEGPQANSWEIVSGAEANDADGDLQRLSLQVLASHSDFCYINSFKYFHLSDPTESYGELFKIQGIITSNY